MAGFFQTFFRDAAKGFFGSEYLRDFTHASKTFRPNGYAYSPKFKFLFHVEFKLNSDVVSKVFKDNSNFGLAVKTVQLPKFSFNIAEMNQYNRKRLVQTKIKYDPVNITFHDDNANLIRHLWYSYYSYYYKDPSQRDAIDHTKQTGASSGFAIDYNKRTPYTTGIEKELDWGYTGEAPANVSGGREGNAKPPFFRSVDVYGFNQHNFVMYSLINPLIESFSHDTYDYSQGNGTMENQMTLQYETVKYYEGAIDGKSPDAIIKTFGNSSTYDRTLSPIARPGSQSNILGQGGLVAAAGGIMGDIKDGNFLAAIQKTGAAAQTFKNPQNILKIAQSEVLAGVNDAIKGTPNRNTPFSFPTLNTTAITRTVDSAIGSAVEGATRIIKSPPRVD
jgi:hypothetical protein